MSKLTLRQLLWLPLACGALLCASLAAAAPATPASHSGDDDATVLMARERFKEGVAFFDKKDFDKARLAFLQAYALKKHPAVLLNLAQSELRSGHEADGALHFAAFLRDATEATPSEMQAAQVGLNAAKVAVAEVEVTVDESGAEVSIDGTLQGTSPLHGPVYVIPGQHSIEARKGSRSAATQVNASAGRSLSATLTLSPRLVLPAAPLDARAGAAPNGDPLAPPADSEPAEERSGRKPFFKWLVSSPVGLVGLSLTGVGVGGGIGFAVASKHSYSNSDSVAAQIKSAAAMDSGSSSPNTTDLCNDPKTWLTGVGYDNSNKTPSITDRAAQYQNACARYPGTVHTGNNQKTVSTVGFVVGGVAALGTVLMYFIDPNAIESHAQARLPERHVALVPSVSPSQSGLTLLGSF